MIASYTPARRHRLGGGDFMCTKLSALRCKEVINLSDGCRLGYVSDLELELPDGRIHALILPGPCRFFKLFGRDGCYRIPWSCIRRIGDDLILVECALPECHVHSLRGRA